MHTLSEFVVMPDHVHLLIFPIKKIGYCLQEFKKSVSRIINWQKGVKGLKVWLDEYHARVILSDDEYSRKVDYIWWNPVKKHLVSEPSRYEFSSANPKFVTDREKFC